MLLDERVRLAIARAPLVTTTAVWVLAESELVPTTLDDAAWLQLGAIAEAMEIAAPGSRIELDPPFRIVAGESASFDRLAGILAAARRVEFRVPALRAPAHAAARLAAAAARHGCELEWIESARCEELGPLPQGSSAAVLIHGGQSAVRVGRAACRVCLEAASLGLATLPTTSARAAVALMVGVAA